MIVYALNTNTSQIILKGSVDDIELLNRIKRSIQASNSGLRMNYKSSILKEKIHTPTVNETSCQLVVKCNNFDGIGKIVTILKDEFSSENIVFEKDIKQEQDNQKLTSSLNYYEAKSKASLTNKVLPEEESKTNHDNLNNQNRTSNNSF